MKKFLSLALALTLCASLAACSSGGNTSGSSSGSDNTSGSGSGSSSQTQTSDMQYVKDKGTLVVGITYFAPMDYKEEGSDEWIGFDADMAKAFAESLGVNVEFQEITWDYKVEELNSKAIDCVWNGMTLSDDVMAAMGTSVPYCTNYQTLIYPADKATDFEGLTSLEEGQTLAIIGSSGSGKTTLLRCLNFLETPNQGTISVNGSVLFDASDPTTQRETEIRKKRLHFGLVFQSFNLFPQYTALQNVTLAKELLSQELPEYKQNKKAILEEIQAEGRELLAKMGLSDRADHYPSQLSGGQQQRVAIARALALKPDILCFDEPTSALDPELTGEVLKVIRSLAEQKTTMIIVTHEMAFARDVADEVMFMDGGVIVEKGPARQVIEHPREERTRQFLSRYAEN